MNLHTDGDDLDVVTITDVHGFGLFDTVIMFDAVDEDGAELVIAMDHRSARYVRAALAQGTQPDVEIEAWQVLSTYTRAQGWTEQRDVAESMAERDADRAAGRE